MTDNRSKERARVYEKQNGMIDDELISQLEKELSQKK